MIILYDHHTRNMRAIYKQGFVTIIPILLFYVKLSWSSVSLLNFTMFSQFSDFACRTQVVNGSCSNFSQSRNVIIGCQRWNCSLEYTHVPLNGGAWSHDPLLGRTPNSCQEDFLFSLGSLKINRVMKILHLMSFQQLSAFVGAWGCCASLSESLTPHKANPSTTPAQELECLFINTC